MIEQILTSLIGIGGLLIIALISYLIGRFIVDRFILNERSHNYRKEILPTIFKGIFFTLMVTITIGMTIGLFLLIGETIKLIFNIKTLW